MSGFSVAQRTLVIPTVILIGKFDLKLIVNDGNNFINGQLALKFYTIKMFLYIG